MLVQHYDLQTFCHPFILQEQGGQEVRRLTSPVQPYTLLAEIYYFPLVQLLQVPWVVC